MDTLDDDLNGAMMALASAWVSDSRWPPKPTSPGRFNVRESLDDLYKANDCVAKAMKHNGIAEKRALYSPNLMENPDQGHRRPTDGYAVLWRVTKQRVPL